MARVQLLRHRVIVSVLFVCLALGATFTASQTLFRPASFGNGQSPAAAGAVDSRSPEQPAAASAQAVAAPPTQPSASYVMSDSSPDQHGNKIPVALRPCPHVPPAGATTGECGAVDRLEDHTTVIMRCWTDSNIAPPGQPAKSQRWFYVNEGSDGPHPGWSGYVFADLVKNQIATPPCTDTVIAQYEAPKYEPPLPLAFAVVGTCTTAGGVLSARSSNFTPGEPFNVAAWYPDGRAYRLSASEGTVRADGSVGWRWPCAGDPAGTYGTRLTDLKTGRQVEAQFTIGVAPATPAPRPVTPSTPRPSTAAPPSTHTAPPPASRLVSVYNKVTNGATQLREDKPAYLSTVTHNFCGANGCMLAGTEVATGAHLTAICQTPGDRTTNGQDNSTVDDKNPGLYTSTRWYGVRWSDGRFGYIAEVWIQPSDRGGLGLVGC